MRRIVFLLEEFSMGGFLEVLLPRFFRICPFSACPTRVSKTSKRVSLANCGRGATRVYISV